MPADVLVDTGAILALLNKADPWHQLCEAAFRQLRLPLLTSEAALTEVFHLVGESRPAMEAAWKLIRSGAVLLSSIAHDELPEIHALMSRYWDRPMDFADATLVYLANRESISTILTIDQNDFVTYRIAGKRRFNILPIERP
jgi:predicted nucleic acid-binding protein